MLYEGRSLRFREYERKTVNKLLILYTLMLCED